MLKEWPCAGISRFKVHDLSCFERRAYTSNTNYPQAEASKQKSLIHQSGKPRPRRELKRPRSEEDVDGVEEEQPQRKKRRLRRDLVTSRLSKPYATPTTHIIGTKAWRTGPWARQKFVGGKLLRKAAILNWIAMKKNTYDQVEATQRETGKATHPLPSTSPAVRSVQQTPAVSKAPFISSDYDIFDYEEDDLDEDGEDENEEDDSSDEDCQAIHSDFRLLETSDTDPEFYDTSWSFVDIESPDTKSGRAEIRLVMENERIDEVSLAPAKSEDALFMHLRMSAIGV